MLLSKRDANETIFTPSICCNCTYSLSDLHPKSFLRSVDSWASHSRSLPSLCNQSYSSEGSTGTVKASSGIFPVSELRKETIS